AVPCDLDCAIDSKIPFEDDAAIRIGAAENSLDLGKIRDDDDPTASDLATRKRSHRDVVLARSAIESIARRSGREERRKLAVDLDLDRVVLVRVSPCDANGRRPLLLEAGEIGDGALTRRRAADLRAKRRIIVLLDA